MNLKPRVINEFGQKPEFLRDGKYVQYTVGNPVLDGSKFSQTTLVKAGTAIHKNTDTGLYELVAPETPDTMVAAVLTSFDVEVESNVNEMVGAIREASVIEARCTGVTDNFKAATKGRIIYDI
ncbi:hypothetical protein QVA60_01725 [Staphylococcus chromogenes]|uniref:hypothetical protein n=1 Tax=Staphylococcus chromogenes TaxID=46126 RepID=UPI0029024F60|nr:hypothetical protein [Staphylococcus chromogenes]MDU0429205.1 hypothetical protein [Staphylococcus chromogenes]